MALAVNRAGTIFKQCDRSSHKPDTNRKCANDTCRHTCDRPEKCPHAWTLRYWVNAKQLEKSFRDTTHPTTGRVNHGSGKKLAQDFQLKLTVDKRAGDITFADHGKAARESFGDAAAAYIARMAVGENSRDHYLGAYRKHVKPVFGDRMLVQVARDRDGVLDLLTVTMKDLSDTLRQQVRMIIVGTCDEAVKADKLAKHLLAGIELETKGTAKSRGDFVFPTHAQVATVADGGVDPGTKRLVQGAGVCVWLMRGCGLRVEEALAVCKDEFKGNGSYLRVSGQASRDGRRKIPLKHRKASDYRDVPVPSWLWEMVKDYPDGPLCPGSGDRQFAIYVTVYRRFKLAASLAGIPDGFTPHSLRHAFASALLGKGVPLGDVSQWLGHKDVNTTYATYRHMMPDAPTRAVAALDAEYAEWSEEAA
jgi:hypothetical protein